MKHGAQLYKIGASKHYYILSTIRRKSLTYQMLLEIEIIVSCNIDLIWQIYFFYFSIPEEIITKENVTDNINEKHTQLSFYPNQ